MPFRVFYRFRWFKHHIFTENNGHPSHPHGKLRMKYMTHPRSFNTQNLRGLKVSFLKEINIPSELSHVNIPRHKPAALVLRHGCAMHYSPFVNWRCTVTMPFFLGGGNKQTNQKDKNTHISQINIFKIFKSFQFFYTHRLP